MIQPLTRRRFLRRLPFAAAAIVMVRPWSTKRRQTEHPEPRPGIDGSNVLTAEELADAPHAIPVYHGIREIPHIADGIRCYCGCAEFPGNRSLLTCYEENGMAMYCDICLGEGRLAYGRWKEGQSLDQIRRAIDARYAPPAPSRPRGPRKPHGLPAPRR